MSNIDWCNSCNPHNCQGCGPAAKVNKCVQCKKEYKHGSNTVGCPKCAPNVVIPESEFEQPITKD